MVSFAESVPPERVAEFAPWIAKLVVQPEEGEDALELRLDGSLGLHAAARSHYDSGDLVLSEKALLRIPNLTQRTKDQLNRCFGSRAPFLGPAAAVDWVNIGPDVRKAALSLFWKHPSFDLIDGTALHSDNLQACELLLKHHESLGKFWEGETLMRFLHIVDLNIHRDDEMPANAEFSGLFVIGSKFSHSCAPNCSWSFNEEGQLQYHAIRPIKPGDLLTFSYIGNGMNLIVSTLERRQRLASLWFICQCSRCVEPDTVRAMRCSNCGAESLMPDYEVDAGKTSDWVAERPLRDLVVDAKTWTCAACGSRCSASKMPLQEEAELSEKVPFAMQGPPEHAVKDAAELLSLRARAAKTLGTKHWTYALATFAWLQKCYVQLRRESTLSFSEADLRLASSSVADWLRSQAPDNAEQAMSALFIALRLASELGGNLQAWGYDPTGMGGERRITGRLQELGWHLSGGKVQRIPEKGVKPRSRCPPEERRPFRAVCWYA